MDTNDIGLYDLGIGSEALAFRLEGERSTRSKVYTRFSIHRITVELNCLFSLKRRSDVHSCTNPRGLSRVLIKTGFLMIASRQ